jgi:hypothetical protein
MEEDAVHFAVDERQASADERTDAPSPGRRRAALIFWSFFFFLLLFVASWAAARPVQHAVTSAELPAQWLVQVRSMRVPVRRVWTCMGKLRTFHEAYDWPSGDGPTEILSRFVMRSQIRRW